jgi:threonine dehydrogenase-like Zn-dependent dehydrogenase
MSPPTTLPDSQHAVQLVGPDELRLNPAKAVPTPGPHQILVRVECTGLCFSDLKLLKQFSGHVRKGAIRQGIDQGVLASLPSYVPEDNPTVPGHEVVARIIAVGDKVTRHKVGERVLVQADFRTLKTHGSNGAFGYNFEGGLQEYVLFDERVVVEPGGERYLIPVEEHLGSSQAALVEPWACVEDSYVTIERQRIRQGGRLLIVAESGHAVQGLDGCLSKDGAPAEVFALVADQPQREAVCGLFPSAQLLGGLEELDAETLDDVVYFGAKRGTIERLDGLLRAQGILAIALGGRRVGEPVSIGVGRIHYGPTRIVATTTNSAADAYGLIPHTGEIRDGDSILVVGAGGPMGQMHVIRDLCSGHRDITMMATDTNDGRLRALEHKARPFAELNKVPFAIANTAVNPLEGSYSYVALMAPVGALVADAIARSRPGAIVNVFAGIPAGVRQEIDIDLLAQNRVFVFGTSGSTIDDMKIVLRKVTSGQLNTDASVDAVSGMAGAVEGIRAVENRVMAGKIIVYPMLHDLPLIPLDRLGDHYPSVAALLDHGQWCPAAEQELLRVAGAPT